MKSKTAFVLLGLLKEKPLNPYEIVKILDRLNISQWSPISASSVYMTIRTLEKKGYITGKKEKNSAMPEKTIYSITPAGKSIFLKVLKQNMLEDVTNITSFNLSTLFICHLERLEVIHILKERAVRIKENDDATERAYNEYRKQSVPEYLLISLKHNMTFYKAELITVELMIEEVEKATEWNHYLTTESS
ncbi:MAG: PadR family transcriptional regulator [Eubacteriales bacterium]|nr:PadR family transcriptional regulator [Eubacteriales bacterium]